MSWGEVKKINSNLNIPLDVAIENARNNPRQVGAHPWGNDVLVDFRTPVDFVTPNSAIATQVHSPLAGVYRVEVNYTLRNNNLWPDGSTTGEQYFKVNVGTCSQGVLTTPNTASVETSGIHYSGTSYPSERFTETRVMEVYLPAGAHIYVGMSTKYTYVGDNGWNGCTINYVKITYGKYVG